MIDAMELAGGSGGECSRRDEEVRRAIYDAR